MAATHKIRALPNLGSWVALELTLIYIYIYIYGVGMGSLGDVVPLITISYIH